MTLSALLRSLLRAIFGPAEPDHVLDEARAAEQLYPERKR